MGRASVGFVALAVAAFLALGTGQASAGQLGCGDTITTNTTLHNDLVNCPNNGIVIGADNITLDLKGHTIDSDGTPAAGCNPEIDFCDVGVVNDSHRGVTVVGGEVREFDFGVFVFGATGNRLAQLTVSRSLESGIILGDSARSRLRSNSVFANGLTTDQAGVVLFASHDNQIERNTVSRNGDIGLFATDSADRNTIERNTLSDNPEAAVLVDEGNGNVVDRNRARRTADLIVSGNRNTIIRNHLSDSRAGPDGGGYGISFEGGHDNLIARNFVFRADVAGIRVADFVPEGGPPAIDNVVRRNHVRRAHDGLLVELTASDTLLERNHATRSEDDGIDADSRTTTLTGNHAVHNDDLGIEAVPGVIDGGGNKASGNGNPAQCTNVVCK